MTINDIHIDLTIDKNRDLNIIFCVSHLLWLCCHCCVVKTCKGTIKVSAYIHFIGVIFQSVRVCTLQSFTKPRAKVCGQ